MSTSKHQYSNSNAFCQTQEISEKLDQYIQGLTDGCSKAQKKFVHDLLYGMITQQSIMLSDTARALDEPIRLLYTEKRLSRNLNSDRLSDSLLRKNHLEMVGKKTKKAVISVDLTDIAKAYGRSQEFLAGIRDESSGKSALGYWAVHIHAVRPDGCHVPLWLSCYSTNAPEFRSQNMQVAQAIRSVRPFVHKDTIWALDRGFDSEFFFDLLDDQGLKWLIRITKKRFLDGMKSSEFVPTVKTPKKAVIRSKGKERTIQFGSAFVKVGKSAKRRRVIVVKGLGKDALVLLTNDLGGSWGDVLELVTAYLRRWACEEATRLIKQIFKLENVRALKYRGIQRLTLFAQLAFGFLSRLHLFGRVLVTMLTAVIPFFAKAPKFPYYQIAAGVSLLLKKYLVKDKLPALSYCGERG